MTLNNAITKAIKLTGMNPRIDGQFRKFDYKGYEISFAQNGRSDEATNYYTRKHNHNDDLTTDYFAGTFHDNLTKAFNFINVITKN